MFKIVNIIKACLIWLRRLCACRLDIASWRYKTIVIILARILPSEADIDWQCDGNGHFLRLYIVQFLLMTVNPTSTWWSCLAGLLSNFQAWMKQA